MIDSDMGCRPVTAGLARLQLVTFVNFCLCDGCATIRTYNFNLHLRYWVVFYNE